MAPKCVTVEYRGKGKKTRDCCCSGASCWTARLGNVCTSMYMLYGLAQLRGTL